jgi:hypothetical protein
MIFGSRTTRCAVASMTPTELAASMIGIEGSAFSEDLKENNLRNMERIFNGSAGRNCGKGYFSRIYMVKSGIDEVLQSFFKLWFNYRICASLRERSA